MKNNASSNVWRLGALALVLAGGLMGAEAANLSAVNEVTKLKNAGLSDDTIISYIQGKNFNYDLSADDIVSLQQQGISPAILHVMVNSGKNNSALISAPPVAVAAVAPVLPPTTLSPDAAYFYQELSPYGHWLRAENGAWFWQPSVIATSPGWRPYYDNGYWTSTDAGWYWTSDYPWAWAAFHYGRWELHPHFGWIWLPDRVWGPAWVTWRNGGDYSGWAPLPPGAVFDVGSARFKFNGLYVAAGFDFGLDWAHFNFCYTKELGEPLHWRPSGEAEVRSVFERTTVVPSYRVTKSVINGETKSHFVNVGVDPVRVGELRGHPVETYKVQDSHTPMGNGVHERIVPEQKVLQTYRPAIGKDNDHRHDGGH